jgi:hypothetical protein
VDAERYISTRDALGPARVERLFALGPAIDPIRRLTENAEFIEMGSQRISKLQLSRLMRSYASNPEENWAAIGLTDGTYLCVDDVSRNVKDENSVEAVLFPQLHMNLVSWWLMHAWRTVELVTSCARNLDEWNLNVAAILARSLIEEVGCLLYEAKIISACWSQLKHLPALDRPFNVRKELHPILLRFRFANRGLEIGAEVEATSVLTYVDKLQKASGLTGLREQYNWLSNAAHPAIGSRIAYMGPPAIHDSGAVDQWRLSRKPATFQGRSADMEFKLAHIASDASTDVAPLGAEILWQSLRFVDDFGLTTKAYRFTDRKYWRKLRPRSSQPQCPCGCGRTSRSQHRWGTDAPSIEIPLAVAHS